MSQLFCTGRARRYRVIPPGRAGRFVRPLVRLFVLPWVALAGACQGDGFKPSTPIDDAMLYWELTLNHRAVTLSTAPGYDTLTLVATPRNRHGVALAGLPQVQYVSRDLDHVVVIDGILRGLAPTGQPIPVVATLTVGNLKHIDSVLVRVVDVVDVPVPPVLDSFSAHPIPPDSAKAAAGLGQGVKSSLPVHAVSIDNTPMTDLLVSFRSSDPSIAVIEEVTGEIDGSLPGAVTFYASTTLFGVQKADTIPYRIGWPIVRSMQLTIPSTEAAIENGFARAPEVRVGVGAIILWVGPTQPYDIVFTEPEASKVAAANVAMTSPRFGPILSFLCLLWQTDCDIGGSVSVTPPSIGAIRVFPLPGTYEYHSTVIPGTGRIVVVAE